MLAGVNQLYFSLMGNSDSLRQHIFQFDLLLHCHQRILGVSPGYEPLRNLCGHASLSLLILCAGDFIFFYFFAFFFTKIIFFLRFFFFNHLLFVNFAYHIEVAQR